MIWKYPPEFDKFIRETAPGRHDWETAELARKAGWEVNEKQVKCYRNNHGIKTGLNPWCSKRKYYLIFTPEIEQFIRDNVNGIQSQTLTDMINEKFGTSYTCTQIQAFKKNHRLKSNVDTRFVEGSPNVRAFFKKGQHANPETEFKKGMTPVNLLPIGSVRGRKDRSGRPQMYIKLTDTGDTAKDWVPYNRYVWEQAHGPIKKGMCVVYIDGDPYNCSLDNLLCVPRGALSYVNQKQLHHDNPEMMKTQYLTAALITETKKRGNDEQQIKG